MELEEARKKAEEARKKAEEAPPPIEPAPVATDTSEKTQVFTQCNSAIYSFC